MDVPTRRAAGRLSARPDPAVPAAPPSPSATELHLAEDVVLLMPPAAVAPLPLLVFFHGAGGHGARSLPVVRDAAVRRGVLVVLPTSVGSTWDVVSGGPGRDVARLDAALTDVLGQFPVGRVAFAGFSDGASYALSLGLANGDLAEAVLAFSPGFAAPPALVGRPRLWVSHGTADAVLPVDRCGRRVVRTARDAGYAVHYEEFEGGHVITPDLVAAAVDWWLADTGGTGHGGDHP